MRGRVHVDSIETSSSAQPAEERSFADVTTALSSCGQRRLTADSRVRSLVAQSESVPSSEQVKVPLPSCVVVLKIPPVSIMVVIMTTAITVMC